MSINEKKNAAFRKMLNEPGIIVAPAVHDCVCAKIAERTGFKAIYMGGNCTAGTLIGQPDIGIISGYEMINRARYIAHCVNIPVVADADTGYGDLNNVWYTVREYEEAGVSAIHIEDQQMPKKCGAMSGVKLADIEEQCEKIKIAQKAKRDPNFVIIGRTDSFKILGIDGAIERGRKMQEAGADMILFAGARTGADMTKLANSVSIPAFSDVMEIEESYAHTDKELESFGCKMVNHNMTTILHAAKIMTDFYEYYYRTGDTKALFKDIMNIRDYEKLMGIEHSQHIRDYLD